MPDDDDWSRFHFTLSREASAGWRDMAGRYGVDRTALAEALGRQFQQYEDTSESRLPDLLRKAIQDARAIQAQRRARGGK